MKRLTLIIPLMLLLLVVLWRPQPAHAPFRSGQAATCVTYSSSDTPLAFDDDTNATSTITVPDSGTIVSFTLTITGIAMDGDGTCDGTVECNGVAATYVSLTSAASTSLSGIAHNFASTDVGGYCAASGTPPDYSIREECLYIEDLVLDDDATYDVAQCLADGEHCATSYIPDEYFSGLTGEQAKGSWVLEVLQNETPSNMTYTFSGWSLNLCMSDYVAATAVPTLTPYGTQTAYPTHTPYPTSTAQPTATPEINTNLTTTPTPGGVATPTGTPPACAMGQCLGETFRYCMTDDDGTALAGVTISVSTTKTGTNYLATALTGADGCACFTLPKTATYYIFRTKAGYTWTNPDSEDFP